MVWICLKSVSYILTALFTTFLFSNVWPFLPLLWKCFKHYFCMPLPQTALNTCCFKFVGMLGCHKFHTMNECFFFFPSICLIKTFLLFGIFYMTSYIYKFLSIKDIKSRKQPICQVDCVCQQMSESVIERKGEK